MAHVLVVDDDPGIRKVLEMSLVDYTLSFATTGHEAVGLAMRLRPDLIVLDMMMPEMDGLETLRALQHDATLATIPVIMLTARVGEEDHFRAYEHGADGYMTKPFDPQQLIDLIENLRSKSPDQRQRARDDEKAKAELLRQLERRFQ